MGCFGGLGAFQGGPQDAEEDRGKTDGRMMVQWSSMVGFDGFRWVSMDFHDCRCFQVFVAFAAFAPVDSHFLEPVFHHEIPAGNRLALAPLAHGINA